MKKISITFPIKLVINLNLLLIGLFFMLLNASIPQHYFLFNYDFYNIHRILELLIFGVIFLGLLLSSNASKQWLFTYQNLSRPAQIILAFFFFWGIQSSIHAGLSANNLLWVAHLAALVLCSFFLASLVRQNPKKTSQILLFLIAITSGYYLFVEWMYYAVTQYLTHFLPGTSLDLDLLIQNLRYPAYGNPRFLGQVLSWILPLVILPYLFFKTKNKPLSLLFLLIAAGLWQMFWMGQSRALYLELLIAGALVPLLFHKQTLAYRYLKAQGLALILGLALYILLYHIGYSLPERSLAEDAGDSGRFLIWHFTLSLILKNPLFGVGPLNFIQYSDKLFNISHPHNAVLFITAEWGIPAGMAFVFLILWALKSWTLWARKSFQCSVNSIDKQKETRIKSELSSENLLLIIALTTSLISGLVNSEFSGTVVMPASQVCMGLIFGWALGIFQHANSAMTPCPEIYSGWRAQLFLKIIILILAALILRGIFPSVMNLPAEQNQACEGAFDKNYPSRCPIIPSYWANHPGYEGTKINLITSIIGAKLN